MIFYYRIHDEKKSTKNNTRHEEKLGETSPNVSDTVSLVHNDDKCVGKLPDSNSNVLTPKTAGLICRDKVKDCTVAVNKDKIESGCKIINEGIYIMLVL